MNNQLTNNAENAKTLSLNHRNSSHGLKQPLAN